jgi:hypothetical protein
MSSEPLREFHEHVNFQGFAGPESSITAFAYANGRERSSLHDPQMSLGHDRSLAHLAWIGCTVQINRPAPVAARPLPSLAPPPPTLHARAAPCLLVCDNEVQLLNLLPPIPTTV